MKSLLVCSVTKLEAGLQTQADLRHRIRQLLLYELVSSERSTELFPVQDVVPGHVHTELRGPQGAPGYSVASVVETGEGSFEAPHPRQHVLLGHHLVGNNKDTLGKRQIQTPTTESMKIIPVTEDLRENLPSILGAESPSMPFSRMNPLSPSSVWAQMMKTSAMGELVIQFLLPFSIHTFPSLSYLSHGS